MERRSGDRVVGFEVNFETLDGETEPNPERMRYFSGKRGRQDKPGIDLGGMPTTEVQRPPTFTSIGRLWSGCTSGSVTPLFLTGNRLHSVHQASSRRRTSRFDEDQAREQMLIPLLHGAPTTPMDMGEMQAEFHSDNGRINRKDSIASFRRL